MLVQPAKRYSATPVHTTVDRPRWIAISVPKAALTTDAQPLTPQAQATPSGQVLANLFRPRGNGMPIRKATGPTTANSTPPRPARGRAWAAAQLPGSVNCSRAAAAATIQQAAAEGEVKRPLSSLEVRLPTPAKRRKLPTTAAAE